jgi:hypothetical protein
VRVAVQLLARSDRRAGCVTRGRGPPCWVRWKSEGRAHLAWLHAACMAARPFARWSGRKRRNARNRWAVACTTTAGRLHAPRWRLLLLLWASLRDAWEPAPAP